MATSTPSLTSDIPGLLDNPDIAKLDSSLVESFFYNESLPQKRELIIGIHGVRFDIVVVDGYGLNGDKTCIGVKKDGDNHYMGYSIQQDTYNEKMIMELIQKYRLALLKDSTREDVVKTLTGIK